MQTRPLLLPLLASIAVVCVGCGKGDTADSSPMPAPNGQSRLDNATKSIQSSSMSSEQKQAAAAYLNQGASNAEQIRKSAAGTGFK